MQERQHQFLYVNPEKCVGCSLCEYACSLKKTDEFNPLKSRIRVVRIHPLVNIALTCKMCKNPPCVNNCPRKALTQSAETGVIHSEKERCDGCGWCIEACPYGAIQYDEDVGNATVCDLCDGKPECMDICPFEAIEFSDSDEHINAQWAQARKRWTEVSKKFIQLSQGEKINLFESSNENMEKIDSKLKILYEKKAKSNKSTK
ncbi:MAG: anaerobic carbon-monoxide dehydrogenase iron sulfur subunit [Thermoproteota archaeon]|nr:anaerobic carbon-monoxide dehydrogenase iron sulfur subunit [Thermoproteota archaeon]